MPAVGVWDCTHSANAGLTEFIASLTSGPFHPGIANIQNALGRSDMFWTLASLKNNPAQFSNPQVHTLYISNGTNFPLKDGKL